MENQPKGGCFPKTHFLFGFLGSFLTGFDPLGVCQRSFNPDGAPREVAVNAAIVNHKIAKFPGCVLALKFIADIILHRNGLLTCWFTKH
jgi:hypothetical protein